ncbi:hypothetical protein D3C87_1458410 [compost metagenome]
MAEDRFTRRQLCRFVQVEHTRDHAAIAAAIYYKFSRYLKGSAVFFLNCGKAVSLLVDLDIDYFAQVMHWYTFAHTFIGQGAVKIGTRHLPGILISLGMLLVKSKITNGAIFHKFGTPFFLKMLLLECWHETGLLQCFQAAWQ